MRVVLLSLLILMASGCGEILYYGYLPGGDFQYYAPHNKIDLEGEHFRLEVLDERHGFGMSCVEFRVDRNTELEGAKGFEFFSAYVRAMIEANNGVIDHESEKIITIKLTGLSAQLIGFGYVKVYGLVEFNATVNDFHSSYCSSMVDGDADAPAGKFSIATRKGALRKMVSGSTRRALEAFIKDLASMKRKNELNI